MTKILISGKGGDGVKFLAILLGKIAFYSDKKSTVILSYGPEARMGSSKAYVTISDHDIGSPVLTKDYSLVTFIGEDELAKNSNEVLFEISSRFGKSRNMYYLGRLAKGLRLDPNLCIKLVKEETGDKYKDLAVQNEGAFFEGYNEK